MEGRELLFGCWTPYDWCTCTHSTHIFLHMPLDPDNLNRTQALWQQFEEEPHSQVSAQFLAILCKRCFTTPNHTKSPKTIPDNTNSENVFNTSLHLSELFLFLGKKNKKQCAQLMFSSYPQDSVWARLQNHRMPCTSGETQIAASESWTRSILRRWSPWHPMDRNMLSTCVFSYFSSSTGSFAHTRVKLHNILK